MFKKEHEKVPWLYIQVSDTGVGISSEDSEKLFQEFSQVGDQSQINYAGTGLGLSISRKFCRLLGGDITVDSKPKVGSTFQIQLPQHLKNFPSERNASKVTQLKTG